MLMRSGLFAAPLFALALVVPAAAEVRPMPRPAALMPVAASEAAPGATAAAARPAPNPVYATIPLEVAVVSHGRHAEAPAPAVVFLPVDAPLLAAVAARTGTTPYEVVVSTANATPVSALATARRPMPRPRDLGAAPDLAAAGVIRRPMPRPFAASAPSAQPTRPAEALPLPAVAAAAPAPALRPEPRPRGLARRDAPAAPEADVVPAAFIPPPAEPGKPLVRGKRGSVCGDPSIRGETVPPIAGRLRGCGVADPVRVTEIDGVRLSTPATIDCTTARAMKRWINDGLRPAFGRKNPPAALQVAASYVCRPRNNIPGNPVSEHGRGKAIDISAIVLESGAVIDVERDWRRSKALRVAHKAACGPFGTTLGPGSDGFHEDHLHFDTANLNRPYCR